MFEFDLTDEELEKVKFLLKGKRTLIIEPSKSTRSTVKKVLTSLGHQISAIDSVDSFHEAREVLSDLSPQFVICVDNIGEQSAQDFLDQHIKKFPNRAECLFVIISKQNSEASAANYLGSEVDAFLCQPFTADGIKITLEQIFKRKISYSSFEKELYQIKSLIFQENWEDAKEKIEESIKDGKKLDELYAILGTIFEKMKNYDKAIIEYQNSLLHDYQNYNSLSGLIRCHKEIKQYDLAYETVVDLLSHYPLAIKFIPEVVKLSIATSNFADLLNYTDLFKKLPELSVNIKKHIGAGLALCGKYLIENGQKNEGFKALMQAQEISESNINVICSVVDSLINNGFNDEAINIIEKNEPRFGEIDQFKVLWLHTLYLKGEAPGQVMAIGSQLIKDNVKAPKVYEIMINASINMQKRPEFIDQIVSDASREHPTLKNFFSSINKR